MRVPLAATTVSAWESTESVAGAAVLLLFGGGGVAEGGLRCVRNVVCALGMVSPSFAHHKFLNGNNELADIDVRADPHGGLGG